MTGKTGFYHFNLGKDCGSWQDVLLLTNRLVWMRKTRLLQVKTTNKIILIMNHAAQIHSCFNTKLSCVYKGRTIIVLSSVLKHTLFLAGNHGYILILKRTLKDYYRPTSFKEVKMILQVTEKTLIEKDRTFLLYEGILHHFGKLVYYSFLVRVRWEAQYHSHVSTLNMKLQPKDDYLSLA